MSLTSITCPECGAGLKSAAGFAPGQTVTCSKCETDFTVTDRAGDEFEPEPKRGSDAAGRSYRNSWLRYAVLGALLAVLGVLGYMLYEKRTKAGNDTASGGGDDDEGKVVEPRVVGPAPNLPQMNPGGGAGGGRVAPPAPQPVVPTKGGKALTADEAKALLVGNWESKAASGTHAIEYAADGTFTYAAETDGQPKTTLRGTWKLTNVGAAADGPQGVTVNLFLEWAVEGGGVVRDGVYLRGAAASHPHLGKAGGERTMFAKKK